MKLPVVRVEAQHSWTLFSKLSLHNSSVRLHIAGLFWRRSCRHVTCWLSKLSLRVRRGVRCTEMPLRRWWDDRLHRNSAGTVQRMIADYKDEVSKTKNEAKGLITNNGRTGNCNSVRSVGKWSVSMLRALLCKVLVLNYMYNNAVPLLGSLKQGRRLRGSQGDRPPQRFRWRGHKCFYPPMFIENNQRLTENVKCSFPAWINPLFVMIKWLNYNNCCFVLRRNTWLCHVFLLRTLEAAPRRHLWNAGVSADNEQPATSPQWS